MLYEQKCKISLQQTGFKRFRFLENDYEKFATVYII